MRLKKLLLPYKQNKTKTLKKSDTIKQKKKQKNEVNHLVEKQNKRKILRIERNRNI